MNWFTYIAKQIGKHRFERILVHLKIKSTANLKEKDLAKILLSIANVRRDDVQEIVMGSRPPCVKLLTSEEDRELKTCKVVEELEPRLFAKLFRLLSRPFSTEGNKEVLEAELEEFWRKNLKEITPETYWGIKEQFELNDDTAKLGLYQYYERLVCYYAEQDDLEVGCYVPASFEYPDCFYRVAGILVTGEGQLGLFLVAATMHMKIPPLRITRGSPITPLKLDYLSHAITDMEPEIGRRGYESGVPYQAFINNLFETPFMEIGFSIGGTIAQWRISHESKRAPSAWFFKSPGVPKFVWEKFNKEIVKQSDPLDLHIFRAKRDFVPYVGEYCLGFQAPSPVKVHLYLIHTSRLNPHLYNMGDPKKAKIEKVDEKEINRLLNNEEHSFFEKGRKGVGKHLLLPILEKARDVLRVYTKYPIAKKIGFWFEKPKKGSPFQSVSRYRA